MVFHLWTNAQALNGQLAFDEAVAHIHAMPYLPILEAGILLPLAFHAGYGIKLALAGKPNVGSYSFTRNWMYLLQRISGMIALVFIGYHLYELRVQKFLGTIGSQGFYPTLCANLSSTAYGVPWVALLYIVGIAACVFHFANGLWGFAFSWGITVSRRSQRVAASVVAIIGLVLFFLGANTALYFATGARFFLPSSSSQHHSHACPPNNQSSALTLR